jgi:hypothetical protein
LVAEIKRAAFERGELPRLSDLIPVAGANNPGNFQRPPPADIQLGQVEDSRTALLADSNHKPSTATPSQFPKLEAIRDQG